VPHLIPHPSSTLFFLSLPQIVHLPREPRDHFHNPRIETNYFTFGHFDWNLSVCPFGDGVETTGKPLIFLTRQTNFDHLCRIKYRLTIGQNDKTLESEVIEQIVDLSGHAQPYNVGYDLYRLTSGKSKLKVKVELISVAAISEVQLCPLNRSKNRAHLYDRDKQEWLIESDVSKEFLQFRMYYSDVRNVPRKFLRYVSWNARVIPARSPKTSVRVLGCPLSNYYAQTDYSEEAYEIETDIPVQDVSQLILKVLQQ
jgi:hypothetical protein